MAGPREFFLRNAIVRAIANNQAPMTVREITGALLATGIETGEDEVGGEVAVLDTVEWLCLRRRGDIPCFDVTCAGAIVGQSRREPSEALKLCLALK